MDLPRKVAICIVMMVPAFVLGGLLYDLSGSWWAVLGLEIVIAALAGGIVSGRFKRAVEEA